MQAVAVLGNRNAEGSTGSPAAEVKTAVSSPMMHSGAALKVIRG
jgi:hypothetical protein